MAADDCTRPAAPGSTGASAMTVAEELVKNHLPFTGQDRRHYLARRRNHGGSICLPITVHACQTLAFEAGFRLTEAQARAVARHLIAEAASLEETVHWHPFDDGQRVVVDLRQPSNERCVVGVQDGWFELDVPPPGIYFVRNSCNPSLPSPAFDQIANSERPHDHPIS